MKLRAGLIGSLILLLGLTLASAAERGPKGGFDFRHPRPAGNVEPGAHGDKRVDFSRPQEQAGMVYDTVLHFPGSEVPAFEVRTVEVNGQARSQFLVSNGSVYNLNRRAHGSEDLALSVNSGWKPGEKYEFRVAGETPSGDSVLLVAQADSPAKTGPGVSLSFGKPLVEFPYHHAIVNVAGEDVEAGTVTLVEVDGVRNRDIRVFNLGPTDKLLEHGALSTEFESYSRRSIGGGKDLRVYVPCNWTNGGKHRVAVTLTTDSGATKVFESDSGAPGSGGYWNAEWPKSVSITLRETAGVIRQGEPVHLMLGLFADDVANPTDEIRVVTYDHRSPKAGADGYVVAPHQILSTTLWRDEKVLAIEEKDSHTGEKVHRYDPTVTVELVFLADVLPYEEKIYQVLYGNPNAKRETLETDLKVSPTKGLGEVIETANYRIGTSTNSGAIEGVTILGKGDPVLLEHKLETNGAVHWNPDCYSPPTPWVHVSDWEGADKRAVSGPILHRNRVHALLPHMNNVSAHVSYSFYAGQPYILMSSLMKVHENIFVQASRNSEIVFNHAVLNEFVWHDPSGVVKSLPIESARKHPTHGLEIPPDTPWMAFINRERKVGFASIQLEYLNTNEFGDIASEAQPYIYVQNGPWIYWSRGLVYPFGGLNFTRMMPVRAGSLYYERNAWVPFRFAEENDPFAEIVTLRKELTEPLLVHEWMGTDARTPETWVMPILTMPFDEGVSGAVSGHKEPKK
ncbi:MAG: hypothetical protein GHCLOJNM_04399 [bacterium]|nr:hypothetical protein [bacterium]